MAGLILTLVFIYRKYTGGKLGNAAGVGSVLLLSLAWFEIREVQKLNPEILELPPRAASLHIRLENIFQESDQFGRISAVGKVTGAPLELEHLVGIKIYLHAYRSEIQSPLIPETEILVKGIFQPVRWGNPQLTGFQTFLERIGIDFMTRRAKVSEVTKDAGSFLHFCHEANLECQKILNRGRGDHQDAANVHVAMMLGNRTVLDKEKKDVFKYSGTMHLFAISGLHVGVIAFTLAAILRWIPISEMGRALIGIGVLWLYVQVTGGQPSAIRAFIMIAVFWCGALVLRKSSPLSALVASAVIVLILDPEELGQLGFQLSYSVVAVILLYGLPMAKVFQDKISYRLSFIPEESHTFWDKFKNRLFCHLAGGFAVCFAAMLGSTPLIVGYFETLVLGGVFLNVLIALLSIVTIVFGALALLFGVLHMGWLVVLVNMISTRLLELMLFFVEKAVMIPSYYLHVQLRHDILAQIMVLALILWLLVARFRRHELGQYFFWIPPVAYAILLALVCLPID